MTLRERLEYFLQHLWIDPGAVVFDHEFHQVAGALAAHDDAPAVRRELDGVRQEIREDLLQALIVAPHPQARIGEGERQFDVLRARLLANGVKGRLDGSRDQHADRMDREPSARAARVVEQVSDEALLRLDGSQHVGGGARHEFGIVGTVLQLRCPSGEHVERRPPFVGDARDELVSLPHHRFSARHRLVRPVARPAQRRGQERDPASLNDEERQVEQVGLGW